MDSGEKLFKALHILKPNVKCVVRGSIVNEENFNKIEWDIDGNFTTTNPHSELTWEAVSSEMDRLQAEYDLQDYARKRDAEYPSIKDQLDKIYHEGIDKWKEDMIKPVKDKHPKS